MKVSYWFWCLAKSAITFREGCTMTSHEPIGVSNLRQLECLMNRFFALSTKETLKLCVIGPWAFGLLRYTPNKWAIMGKAFYDNIMWTMPQPKRKYLTCHMSNLGGDMYKYLNIYVFVTLHLLPEKYCPIVQFQPFQHPVYWHHPSVPCLH